MISILIPVYNYDCTELLRSLYEQGVAMKNDSDIHDFDFEIIVVEDGSNNNQTCIANRTLMQEIGQRYVHNSENLGSARTRNLLLSLARYPHCVVMDCDALVCTDDFLRRYWQLRNSADVVCGRIVTPAVCPPGCELRHLYEMQAEGKRSMEYREKHPYHHFTAFNVLFNAYVFRTLKFDERCTEYGYEDALMGLMLQREGYKVIHADIPLIHNGMDENAAFVRKTETSLRVLRRLGEPMQSFSKISRIERGLRKCGMAPCVYFLLKRFSGRLMSNLLGSHPSLLCFNLYKLYYYIGTYYKKG